MTNAITVANLSKRYRIGLATKSTSTIKSILTSPFRYLKSSLTPPNEAEILWALNNVSFDVGEGEVVGIIGNNGAGKSTLLKILSRITDPTSGRIELRGRVGSLLEVGTGFHPELTGRENIYLSGTILGMRRKEIDQKFQEIAQFAEIERFLDTPVKRYSSGMYVRLAFAVAAHLEPEILLVDEVLAVGDIAFQKKCLGKMGDVSKQGRTILFVSHNMIAIQNLCEKTIWIDKGEVKKYGPTHEVISAYLSLANKSQTLRYYPDQSSAPGNELIKLRRVSISPKGGGDSQLLSMDSELEVTVEYWNLIPKARLHVSMQLFNENQTIVFATASKDSDPDVVNIEYPAGALIRTKCTIPGNLLNSGLHKFLLLIHRNTTKIIYRLDDALTFEVIDMGERAGTWYGKEPGAVHPLLMWQTEQISPPNAE